MDQHVVDPFPCGQLDQRFQVTHRSVHPAVGDKAEQVQAIRLARSPERLVLEERAILDRLVDAQQVLLDDRLRPQVQMAHPLFPICPSGSPTASPQAVRVVCGYLS